MAEALQSRSQPRYLVAFIAALALAACADIRAGTSRDDGDAGASTGVDASTRSASGPDIDPPASAVTDPASTAGEDRVTLHTIEHAHTADGRLVTVEHTIWSDYQTVTTHLRASVGGELAIEASALSARDGSSESTYHYGPSFRGIATATFRTLDGTTFTGLIDGRELAPYTADTDPANIRFLDGEPLPELSIDPAVRVALQEALAQAQESTAEHLDATGPRTVLPYMPGSETQRACYRCGQQCARILAQCSVLAMAPLLACFFPPACPAAAAAAGIALGTCQTAALACMGWCAVDDCCPQACGIPSLTNPGSGCCDANEQCVSESDPDSRQGCCPSGQATCGGDCCAPTETCCGDACCAAGSACLQGLCCPAETDTVCNGACCDGVCDANGQCCGSPNSLCGGQCCSAFASCCNDQCLGDGQTCVGGNPCPSGQACGDVCCAEGQICTSGTCTAPAQPTLLLFTFPGGFLIGQSGGPVVNVVQSQTLRIGGRAFSAGPVDLTLDTVGGTALGTAVADASGAFLIDIAPSLSLGAHRIVGSQGSSTAYLDINVFIVR